MVFTQDVSLENIFTVTSASGFIIEMSQSCSSPQRILTMTWRTACRHWQTCLCRSRLRALEQGAVVHHRCRQHKQTRRCSWHDACFQRLFNSKWNISQSVLLGLHKTISDCRNAFRNFAHQLSSFSSFYIIVVRHRHLLEEVSLSFSFVPLHVAMVRAETSGVMALTLAPLTMTHVNKL